MGNTTKCVNIVAYYMDIIEAFSLVGVSHMIEIYFELLPGGLLPGDYCLMTIAWLMQRYLKRHFTFDCTHRI